MNYGTYIYYEEKKNSRDVALERHKAKTQIPTETLLKIRTIELFVKVVLGGQLWKDDLPKITNINQ